MQKKKKNYRLGKIFVKSQSPYLRLEMWDDSGKWLVFAFRFKPDKLKEYLDFYDLLYQLDRKWYAERWRIRTDSNDDLYVMRILHKVNSEEEIKELIESLKRICYVKLDKDFDKIILKAFLSVM